MNQPEHPMNITEFARYLDISVPTVSYWITNNVITVRVLNPRNPHSEKLIDPDEIMRVKTLIDFAALANVKPMAILGIARALRTGQNATEILTALNPSTPEDESSDDGEAEHRENDSAAVA